MANQGGRPTSYTQEIADEITTRLADGESLRRICADDHMPEKSTVLLWVVRDREGFSDQYRAAREAAGYSHGDEALDLRYRVLSGEVDPQSAKVVLDALKWGAERMAPKSHSPRVQQEHTGKDGGPIQTEAKIDPSGLSDSTLAELMAARKSDT
jgi:hypothetical protein